MTFLHFSMDTGAYTGLFLGIDRKANCFMSELRKKGFTISHTLTWIGSVTSTLLSSTAVLIDRGVIQ